MTCGLAPTHMLMIWLLPETGSTVRHPRKDSKHTVETTSESLLRTITSTVRKLQSRCWESRTTPSTTTRSLELQKTVKQELRQAPDTVSSPTTLCWTLMAVSTWKTLRAHLLQPLPCVPLLRTPTVRSRAVPSPFHPESRSMSILNPTTGVAKSDLKSPSLMVQPIPGLLVRSPRTQHTTASLPTVLLDSTRSRLQTLGETVVQTSLSTTVLPLADTLDLKSRTTPSESVLVELHQTQLE